MMLTVRDNDTKNIYPSIQYGLKNVIGISVINILVYVNLCTLLL